MHASTITHYLLLTTYSLLTTYQEERKARALEFQAAVGLSPRGQAAELEAPGAEPRWGFKLNMDALTSPAPRAAAAEVRSPRLQERVERWLGSGF